MGLPSFRTPFLPEFAAPYLSEALGFAGLSPTQFQGPAAVLSGAVTRLHHGTLPFQRVTHRSFGS